MGATALGLDAVPDLAPFEGNPVTEIVHILAWKLNGDTPVERQRQADTIVAAVAATRGRIPGLVSLDVGPNLIDAADAWDVGAVMVFASRADLDAYQTHPEHLALKAVVAPLRSARAQCDLKRSTAH
jgi:hypothetical protein